MRGIVYLLYGMPAAERLVVSAWSLRRHYGGPVTVLCGGEGELAIGELLRRDLDCRCERFDPIGLSIGRPMLVKTWAPRLTPYEDTVFLDADTLVTGPLDELFGWDLTLVQDSYRTTRHRLPRKWIGKWRGSGKWAEILVDRQLRNEFPFINTGVFGFRKGNKCLRQWLDLAETNPDAAMVDQTAMQLLTSGIPHRMMDERFCRCPSWGKATEDVRVWHFHGSRHCKPKANCESVWGPAFLEARASGVCGLDRWAGRYDRKVRGWMRRRAT